MDESFLVENAPDGGLFQSEDWARFQQLSGHRTVHFSDHGFSGFAFQMSIPLFGPYLYIPRGPVCSLGLLDPEMLGDTLTKLAIQEKTPWIRIEPQTEEVLAALRGAFAQQLVPAPHDVQPRETFMVSLDGDEESWLARMKGKTRYNVRLAEKHGVTTRFSREKKDFEVFFTLLQSTARRQQIRLHPKDYYRAFLEAFDEKKCVLALAEQQGEVLSAELLVFFGHTAYYLHGGSSDTNREFMAPFLLHFASMREAKRRGMTFYDFGGVRFRSKRDKQDEGWEGITRFKLNFAPNQETIVFPGTYDIIFNSQKYFLYTKSRLLRNSLQLLKKMSRS